jgi:hypothetical protein
VLEALHLRDVRVPIDDGVAVLETRRQPGLAPKTRAGIVNDPDPEAVDLDDTLPGQPLLKGLLVHVPADTFEQRPELPELLIEDARDEVAAVQQNVGAADQPDALSRQGTSPPREVRVGDDGDAAQEAAATRPGSWRKRPAFQTSSPSA